TAEQHSPSLISSDNNKTNTASHKPVYANRHFQRRQTLTPPLLYEAKASTKQVDKTCQN
ncbi:hypothetical protein F2P81_010914, partial [Scophthalmus maximus]